MGHARGFELPRLLFEITELHNVSSSKGFVLSLLPVFFNPWATCGSCRLELAEPFHTMEVQPSFSFLQEQQLGHASTSFSG